MSSITIAPRLEDMQVSWQLKKDSTWVTETFNTVDLLMVKVKELRDGKYNYQYRINYDNPISFHKNYSNNQHNCLVAIIGNAATPENVSRVAKILLNQLNTAGGATMMKLEIAWFLYKNRIYVVPENVCGWKTFE